MPVASSCAVSCPAIPHIHSVKRLNANFVEVFAKSSPDKNNSFPLDFGCADKLLGTQPGKHHSLI